MQIFVHAPENFNNLCVMIRTLECMGITQCLVHDPHKLIRERYGKSYSQRLRTISAGAFFKIQFTTVEHPLDFIRGYNGRKIATVPTQSAQSLYGFRFIDSDMLVFGSEAHGLPQEIVAACDEQITIPQKGLTQSLNLCVASGIILAEWCRQAHDSKKDGQ